MMRNEADFSVEDLSDLEQVKSQVIEDLEALPSFQDLQKIAKALH